MLRITCVTTLQSSVSAQLSLSPGGPPSSRQAKALRARGAVEIGRQAERDEHAHGTGLGDGGFGGFGAGFGVGCGGQLGLAAVTSMVVFTTCKGILLF